MHPEYVRQVTEAAGWVRERFGRAPVAALVAGTGLGGILEGVSEEASFSFAEIPHFPAPTVAGHRGRLLAGTLAGRPVIAFSGRLHLYEGHSALTVTFPVRLAAVLGARVLVLANATGGLNPDFSPGDVMVIEDHLNLTGENPLVGGNHDPWGPRFPEMAGAWDPGLLESALSAAGRLGIELKRGVYAGLKGPSLETPAEMRFLRRIGADVVGFSTVNEAIAARHHGMRVLGFAVVTNKNVPGALTPASLPEILAHAESAAPRVRAVVGEVIAGLAD